MAGLIDTERTYPQDLVDNAPLIQALVHTPKTAEVLARSVVQAKNDKYPFVHSGYLLMGLLDLKTEAAAKLLARSGVTQTRIHQIVLALADRRYAHRSTVVEPRGIPSVRLTLEQAGHRARMWNHDGVDTKHILHGILTGSYAPIANRALALSGVDIQSLAGKVAAALHKQATFWAGGNHYPDPFPSDSLRPLTYRNPG